MDMNASISRRDFVTGGIAVSAIAFLPPVPPPEIVDIHQHTHYAGRRNGTLIAHQRTMGITKTVLLPAGSKLGLDADCYGNDSVVELAREFPGEFVFFANEVPDLDVTRPVIEKYLKVGACGIGEQKFPVDCDSPAIFKIAELAQEYKVPILLHFQHNKYNINFLKFHKVLERFPKVNFIGHAQTFWGNIDKNHVQEVLYPKGPVVAGGYTDRLLSDYPNMFADLSAGSCLNALRRDEEHAHGFLHRHKTKLLYGSDCDDFIGDGTKCSGSQCLAVIRKHVTDKKTLEMILADNAKRVIPTDRRV
ncbi:MAG: amidohydrolase [Chthonomonadales bacterium]